MSLRRVSGDGGHRLLTAKANRVQMETVAPFEWAMYDVIPPLDVVHQRKMAPLPPSDVTKPALLRGQCQSAPASKLCYHYH